MVFHWIHISENSYLLDEKSGNYESLQDSFSAIHKCLRTLLQTTIICKANVYCSSQSDALCVFTKSVADGRMVTVAALCKYCTVYKEMFQLAVA